MLKELLLNQQPKLLDKLSAEQHAEREGKKLAAEIAAATVILSPRGRLQRTNSLTPVR